MTIVLSRRSPVDGQQDDEIQVEEIVQLNSGGPDMTVTGIGSRDGVRSVWCRWFGDGTLENGIFPLGTLKHAPARAQFRDSTNAKE
jgi:uncharacterized protein YodC (DUF2158 family)